MKTWDAIILGGGIIGVSLALELRKHGATVMIVERGEPGREASYAAAGMLAPCAPHTPERLLDFAIASARLWPEFVHELEDESGEKADLRRDGSIVFLSPDEKICALPQPAHLSDSELARLEPNLAFRGGPAVLLQEMSSDARALTGLALAAAKHRGVEIASGFAATEIEIADGRAVGVKTTRTHFRGSIVVNCCGAWSGQVRPHRFPVRPVKGQMLSVAMPAGTPGAPAAAAGSERLPLRHVVRSSEVYLVPRSDGRIVIGSTLEEAGFDKRVDADTVHRLHQAAANLVPEIGQMRILEFWAGLRPGTPDDLPILGATETPGYFVATGHFRNGILLAPMTARVMAQVVRGQAPEIDITAFSPARFA